MNLLIISHTPHYQQGDQVLGWGATIREIDQLATLFDEVVHLAPLHSTAAPDSALAYQATNVHFHPVKPAGGTGLLEKLGILWGVPGWLVAMRSEMQKADAVHIRCPAGISLVGLLAARLWARGKPIWVKYAGNWKAYPGQALSYKFQRWYINKNLHNGVVSVNGHWDGQNIHVFSFLNPSFSEEEYLKEKEIALKKQLSSPYQLLFVGNLSRAKGVDRVLEITKILDEIGFEFELTLVGDGPERPDFERFVKDRSLTGCVGFAGWQPITALHQYYRKAHLFIFPSESESWPKVLSEAMAHGVVPLASDVGSIKEILVETGAGRAFSLGNNQLYIDAIFEYAQDPQLWKDTSLKGINAAKKFTYEHYLSDVKRMFYKYWQVKLDNE